MRRLLPSEALREQREREAAEAERHNEALVQASRRLSLAIARALPFSTDLYFLVVAPGIGDTVKLQRLTMGEESCISGAIFSGFGWRPRA